MRVMAASSLELTDAARPSSERHLQASAASSANSNVELLGNGAWSYAHVTEGALMACHHVVSRLRLALAGGCGLDSDIRVEVTAAETNGSASDSHDWKSVFQHGTSDGRLRYCEVISSLTTRE